jgi:hypothetical protein
MPIGHGLWWGHTQVHTHSQLHWDPNRTGKEADERHSHPMASKMWSHDETNHKLSPSTLTNPSSPHTTSYVSSIIWTKQQQQQQQ